MIQRKQKRILKAVGTIGLLIASAISGCTQETPIYRLYSNLLSQSDDGQFKASDIDSQVNDATVSKLSQAEVSAVLPLALQCIRSSNVEISRAGMLFLVAVVLRREFDSAKLLEPYIDDFGKLLDDRDFRWRQGVFFILGHLNPKPPDKAIAYFAAHLEGSSGEDTQAFAVLLLNAAPADPSIVHRVLSLASARANRDLTMAVLKQLGLSRIQFPEAVDFISANLNQDDKYLREQAVDAASRLDKDTRAQLSGQLSQIASDPKEDKEVRQQAAQALQP